MRLEFLSTRVGVPWWLDSLVEVVEDLPWKVGASPKTDTAPGESPARGRRGSSGWVLTATLFDHLLAGFADHRLAALDAHGL